MQSGFYFILPLICGLLFMGCNNGSENKTSSHQTSDTIEITEAEDLPSLIIEEPDIYADIFRAVKNDDKTRFEKLLKQVNNIDSLVLVEEDEYYSILGYCCVCNRIGFINALLARNADINNAKEDAYYAYDALYLSVVNQNLELVSLFLTKGADVNRIYNEERLTALCLSCMDGNYDISKLLIDNGANVNGMGYAEGTDYVYYPLLFAARSGNIELVSLLLEKGADFDISDRQGNTPLSISESEEMRKFIESYSTEK